MKKAFTLFIIIIASLFNSGCGTVLGGRISQCQKTIPDAGKYSRQLRPAAMIFDILFWPGYIIDFATGGIYRPCTTEQQGLVAAKAEAPKAIEDNCSKRFIREKNQSKKSTIFSQDKTVQTKFLQFYRNGSRQLYISFVKKDKAYVVIQQYKVETLSFKNAFVLGNSIRIGIIFENDQNYILSFNSSENDKQVSSFISTNNSSNVAVIDSSFDKLLKNHRIVKIEIQNPFNDFNQTKIRTEGVSESDGADIKEVYNCFLIKTSPEINDSLSTKK